MSRGSVEELALSDLDRSNKGASKQRRDLINAEVANMRDLLPLSESARQRLSQLQVMSLSCVFIRKCNVLSQLFSSLPSEADMPTMCDFSQALSGFLLITTREGKLVYISENVTDYLGHSMVDMKTQGDSLYDIVDKRDEANVRAHLLQAGSAGPSGTCNSNNNNKNNASLESSDLSGRDVSFFCRMNMSRTLKRQSAFGDTKVMHVRGHFQPLSDPNVPNDGSSPQHHHHHQHQQQRRYAFVAMCSPLIMPELKESLIQSNTLVFKTVHNMDMTFLEVTKTAEYHLGCSTEEICKSSWYSMVHPEDIREAREKHVLLIRASHELGCMLTVRLLTRKGEIMWVNTVMQVYQSSTNGPSSPSSSSSSHSADDGVIVCINQVISEDEARQLRLQSHTFTMYPPRPELWNGTTAIMPPTHTKSDICWRPSLSSSSSSSSCASPHQGLPPSASLSPVSQLHPLLPASPAGFMPQPVYHHTLTSSSSSSSSCHLSNAATFSSSSSSSSSSPVHHTDLKLMLKRKLQGPHVTQSTPKVPRMAAHDPKKAGSVPESFSWSGSSQVMPQQALYKTVQSVPTRQTMKTPAVMSSGQVCLSPPKTSVMTMTCQGPEQVVPQNDAKVAAIPESFLTPESSPASSPDPHTPASNKRGTAAVLGDMHKLPVFLRSQGCVSVGVGPGAPTTTPTPAPSRPIKVEQSQRQCVGRTGPVPRRELPVMDASDIESFFHTLDCSETFTAAMTRTPLPEMHPSTGLETQPPMKPAVPVVVQTSQASYPRIKQEQETLPVPTGGQQQQPQMTQKAKDQPLPSPAQHADELEELLGFFAGEMTATQLNLEGLLCSSLVKEEADDQCPQEPRQAGRGCSAGNLDPFLLQGSPLERHPEGFSPVSPSDVSCDEDTSSSGDDPFDKLNMALSACIPGGGIDKHGYGGFPPSSPPVSGPSPPTPCPHLPQTPPQNVAGMEEEDELYQLDKLLSLMASGNGVMPFSDSQ